MPTVLSGVICGDLRCREEAEQEAYIKALREQREARLEKARSDTQFLGDWDKEAEAVRGVPSARNGLGPGLPPMCTNTSR